MAIKGERGSLEPLALRLYAEGKPLSEISEVLGVSETSLRKWKNASAVPGGEGPDEWDQARMKKSSNRQRIFNLFERELTYYENQPAGSVDSKNANAIIQLFTMVERVDKYEKAKAVATEVAKEVKKAGLSDEAAENIKSKILGIGQ